MITSDSSAPRLWTSDSETAGGTEAPGVRAAPRSGYYPDLPLSSADAPDGNLSSEDLKEMLAFRTSEINRASPPGPEPRGLGAADRSPLGDAAIADHLLREALRSGFWETATNPLPGSVAVPDPRAGAGIPQTATDGPRLQVPKFETDEVSSIPAPLVTLPPDDVALRRALDGWHDGRTAITVPPLRYGDHGGQTMIAGNQIAARPRAASGSDQRNPLAATAQIRSTPGAAEMMQRRVGSFSRVESEAIRADFPILHQQVNGYPLAWLDNAATTQKPRQVTDALTSYYHRDNSNVHRGAHTLAARATDAYEKARATVHRLLKSKLAEEIVFVRGTTEGINLVAQSYGRSVLGPGDEVVVTILEHHSNIVPWQMICREKGAVLRPIPITDAGEVDLNAYVRMLGSKTRIVALAHVSNVLGTVLPVCEMTAMAHAVGARVLIDGAQAIAHMPVDVCSIGCDFYTFSGHKIFGPTGVGALYGRLELLEMMPPWQGGGSMIDRVRFEETTYAPVPAKFEAGTGILAGAVGLAAALDYVQRVGLERIAQHEHALLQSAMTQLAAIPGLRLYGKAPNKAAVTAFLIDGIEPEKVGRFLDCRGIAVRVGHHCAQPTMDRYGVPGMVRPSFAVYNTFDEVDRLVAALYELKGTGRG
jgi:cysteine desulfurase / selenocysteine lyase